MEAGSISATSGRSVLERPRGRLADPILRWVLTGLAGLILVLIAFFFIRLFVEAKPAFDQFGYIGFVFDNNWDVSKEIFGAWPLVVGTLITSAIALLIGVPVAIATALYVTELCPRRIRQPLTILVELLAAVPSVVYGLWGIKVLAPKLEPAEQWFSDKFSFLPLVGGPVSIPNCFIAGLIMAIMILPIVSAISREVMATVPPQDKEGALALVLTIVAIVPLVLILYYLVKEGIGAWSGDFFTTDPTGRFLGNPGGIKSAIWGTILMVALASVIAIPIGIGVALYLVEYGKSGKFANLVRYFVDVMTGVPSVVFGLFVYIVLVVTKVGGTFAGWKGSIALALLMLPVVTRSAEVVLNLVPDGLREKALALDAPRWRVVFRVVLPTALPGLVTGSLLAVARAAGETAPLLFTAAFVFGTQLDLSQRMNSLPLQIFNDVSQAQDRLVQRAWGAALTLVVLVLILSLLA